MADPLLLIFFSGAFGATAFLFPRLVWFAGWLWQTPQAENAKQTILLSTTELGAPIPRRHLHGTNVERYDLRKDGNVGFSHPWGTHDDVFWSIALGGLCYG